MKKNKLESTALLSPHQLKRGLPLAPKLVFLATLSLYVASTPVAANPAVVLPDSQEPGLDIEFRCAGGGACPLDIDDNISFGGAAKYLSFEGAEGGEGACFYTPVPTEGVDGIGVECRTNGDRIADDEFLAMLVFDADGGEGGEGGEGSVASSTAMKGIYLNGLTSFAGDGCLTGTAGTVHVELDIGAPLDIGWTSDSTPGGGGGCAAPNPHAIFVDFGGTREVASIEVSVDFGGGVYAAGIELADVSPDTCSGAGENNTGCEIVLVDDPLLGGDLRAIIADPSLTGSIGVSDGFPIRVRDDRDACQWDAEASDMPEPLIMDGFFNVDGIDGVEVSLVVSANTPGSEDFFTISAKGCGVPRATFDGPPVDRDEEDSAPYIDIIAMETDIFPVAGVLGFESDGLNDSDYKCEPLIANRDLDQPFLEINARADESKYLSNVPPMGVSGAIDPVGRDIMVGCGSKRGEARAYSFVAWNLIHAEQTNMHAELSAEIAVLEQTVARALICVDPIFASRNLRWPRYIRRTYDAAVTAAAAGDAGTAGNLVMQTAMLVDRFRAQLERPGGSSGFERCWAAGANLDAIIDSNLIVPAAGDVPLNAYGDIISQLEHLSYALRSFEDELKQVP